MRTDEEGEKWQDRDKFLINWHTACCLSEKNEKILSEEEEKEEEKEESDYEYSKPLDGETLKDYFQRTQQEYLDAVNSNGELADAKKARNDAFLAAQSFFKSFSLK